MLSVRQADRAGDLGWVVMVHGEVYHREFGWTTAFETMVARIVADFAAGHDPAREALWIAERDGERVGSVALVADDMPDVARLRVLLVSPAARGLGAGARLVRQALEFALDRGYRRVVLWTVDGLESARKIYQAEGFVLAGAEPHAGFGHPVTGQTWVLELAARRHSMVR
ncbi:GNAT family N-acetyltransferase [Actinoplanes derwentensis]|uniref:Acetyltransferase (GNAT) family protein n=1 Tax=Actinoplanes derwentensis TaxID=113562 RepID=A0A1H1YUT5_9ACTN|nr:GNAT family N-acetyltransferase [Actinoplanes derwentensis]GID81298.1 MarR family transcriptional regulator [Actinoplanes derwentensis]SDT25122.1 Acetyltransferase (GNAT) family protein [Actinoplanes derwentensis]